MKILTTLLLSLFSLQVLAAQSDSNLKIVDEPQSDVIYRDSSAFNRLQKNFSINYMAFGFGPNPAGSVGLNFGFFLDRNSLIDFEYTAGRPLNYVNWKYSEYDVNARSYGVHYKLFTGNSFYVRGGVDYRMVDYLYKTRDFSTSIENSRSAFKGSSLNATFLIGNQWQWENFTLGCDWIGLTVPLSTQIDSESFTTTSTYTSSTLKDDQDYYLKRQVTMGLRFYLGATF
jgi:hypothetical protein